MGRETRVPPFITDVPEKGGSLHPDALADVQNMVAEKVAGIAEFRRTLNDVLVRKYPSNITLRNHLWKSITQRVDTLPTPDWFAYSGEQLKTYFGENAVYVQTALSAMKMRKK